MYAKHYLLAYEESVFIDISYESLTWIVLSNISFSTIFIMTDIPVLFVGGAHIFTRRRGTQWNEKASLRVPQACSIHTCGREFGWGGDPGKFEGGGRGVFSGVHLDAGNGLGGGAIPLPARWIRLPILQPTLPVTPWLSFPALSDREGK